MKKKYRNGIILSMIFLVSVCFISACISTENRSETGRQDLLSTPTHTPVPENISPANNTSSEITGFGTVIYQDLEGGFYGIIADDGRQYLPISLPEELKENGTMVSFVFRPVQDTASIFMWGEQVQIVSISKVNTSSLDSSNVPFIEYEKAGGVMGAYEMLWIYPDLRGKVTKWNQEGNFTLNQTQMDSLVSLINQSGISPIKNSSFPSASLPDAISYTLRYENHILRVTDKDMSEQSKPIFQFLDILLNQHTISPIEANVTLEGTSWNLMTYVRSDGIIVNVSNRTSPSLQIVKGGIITGNYGCNQYSGTYNHSGNNLTFGIITQTEVACSDPANTGIDSNFLTLMSKVSHVDGKERILTFSDAFNKSLMVFELSR